MAQATLQIGSCLMLFGLVKTYFGRSAAVAASLLLGTDLMLAVSNFEGLSEPLFLFLELAAASCLVPAFVRGSAVGRWPTWSRLIAGGTFLGLATLTRPVGLYLSVILVACRLAIGLVRRRPGAAVRDALLVAVPVAALVVPWMVRNAVVFSVPRLTTVDRTNLVYFVGAGAYQVERGLTLDRAQEQIAREFQLPGYSEVQNPCTTDRSVAEMDETLGRAAPVVLGRYPVELATSMVIGIVKSSLSHNVDQLAGLLSQTWTPPGTGDLLRVAFSGIRSAAGERARAGGGIRLAGVA